MNWKMLCGVLSALFSCTMYLFYIEKLISDPTVHPTLSSWISWTIMDAAILAVMINKRHHPRPDEPKTPIPPQLVAYIIGGLAVIGCSWWKGAAMGWTILDTACLLLVIVAIAWWAAYSDPAAAVAILVAATVVSCAPQFKTVWYTPTSEPALPWALVTIGSAFGIFAVPQWSWKKYDDWVMQVTFFGLQLVILLLIIR